MKTADHKRMASSRLFRQSGVVACATPRLFAPSKKKAAIGGGFRRWA
jgi:hypothetical protein